MSNDILLVDANALENIFSAGGEKGFDLLLRSGFRIGVLDIVLDELRDAGPGTQPAQIADSVESFIERVGPDRAVRIDASLSYADGDLFELLPDGTRERVDDIGDIILRDVIAGDDLTLRNDIFFRHGIDIISAEFSLLTDDSRFVFQIAEETSNLDPDALRAAGHERSPYGGKFDFWSELYGNAEIIADEFLSLRNKDHGAYLCK